MNLTDNILISFVPSLGKVPLRFTFPKTWKHEAGLDLSESGTAGGIKANKFYNNSVSLEINPSVATQTNTVGVNLNCNLFYTDNAISRTGIVIKPNTQALRFGFYTDENAYGLAGNVWPTTTTDRSVVPAGNQDVNAVWHSPSNWTSIKNNSSNRIDYNRFKNEFVGNTNSFGGIIDYNVYSGPLKAYTTSNNYTPPFGSTDYQLVCTETEAAASINFPTPNLSKDDSKPFGKNSDIKTSMQGNGLNIIVLNNNSIATVQLLDVLGRIILTKTEINRNSFNLPLENLCNGTYILKLQKGNGETFSTKILR
jgi:Secretion system C-terminal sorting domain